MSKDSTRASARPPLALRRFFLAALAVLSIAAVAVALPCAVGQRCLFLASVVRGDERIANPPPLRGLAIIGDSTQDEYQADNPRGGDYVATTFNWVELLARYRGVNVGPWGERPEPRREGYEYNWARSAATTQTMIEDGQHTGVAEQVRAGKVSHVLIQIGINDFYQGQIAEGIYTGEIAGPELQDKIGAMAANIEQAVKTIKAAGDVQVMLASTQDYVTAPIVPEAREIITDAAGRQRLIDAFALLNEKLEQIAIREEIVFFDFNSAFQAELARRTDRNNFLIVGGEKIDLSTRGNDPRHGLLGDEYVHPGTVMSALFANVYIEKMNAVYGTEIAPLTDEEILRAAGIRP